MTVAKLLADLQARGARFIVEGQRLLYDAPRGVMKPSDLEQLHAHKAELIDYLNKEAAQHKILEGAHSGGKDGKPLIPKQTEASDDNHTRSADPNIQSHSSNVESVRGLCGVECATRHDDGRTAAGDKDVQARAAGSAERHGKVRIGPGGLDAGPQSHTQTDARRRAVLKMLQENPNLTHAYTTDDESDPEYVILTIAIRGKGTCDMRIRRDQYDGFAVLRLIHELSLLTPVQS